MAGLIDLGIDYKRQANAGFGEVSKARTEQALFNRKMNAQNKAGAYQAAGTGLGLGYTAYQNGMLGKAAETLKASPEVVKALTPTPEPPTTPTPAPTAPPAESPPTPAAPPTAPPAEPVIQPEAGESPEAAAEAGDALAGAGEAISSAATGIGDWFAALLL